MKPEKPWFGKHKGKELSEVPSGYLRWMTETFPEIVPGWREVYGRSPEEREAIEGRWRDFLQAAEHELKKRGNP